jgi:hypothetical protein
MFRFLCALEAFRVLALKAVVMAVGSAYRVALLECLHGACLPVRSYRWSQGGLKS